MYFNEIISFFHCSQVRELVLTFVTASKLSFSIVENKDLNALISYVSNDKVKLPTAKTLLSDLDACYTKMTKMLLDVIEKAEFVCTTADIWTHSTRSFMGATIHLFNEQNQRKSYLLAFRRMFGRHTSGAIRDILRAFQKEFRIKKPKNRNIITDGAKAFVAALKPDDDTNKTNDNATPQIRNAIDGDSETIDVEEIFGSTSDHDTFVPDGTVFERIDLSDESEDECDDDCDFSTLPPQFRCTAHSLNLLGSVDIDKRLKSESPSCYGELNTAIGKLTKFWSLNNQSPNAHEIIMSICKRSFPRPSITRWNSSYDSIKIAEQNRKNINDAIAAINVEEKKNGSKSKKNNKLEKLTGNEWKLLKDYTSALEPIADALDVLQGDKNACLGYVLPALYVIKNLLEKNLDNLAYKSEYGEEIYQAALKCLKNRFGAMMRICDENKDLILASAVHPNFKLSWIHREEDREFVQTLLINTYIEIANNRNKEKNSDAENTRGIANSKSNEKKNNFFKHLRAPERSSNDETLTFEIWKYILLPIDDPDLQQLRDIPHLEYMFRMYNTTLSSSASVERIFSQALLVFTPQRNRISDANFEKALFVRQNRELFEHNL